MTKPKPGIPRPEEAVPVPGMPQYAVTIDGRIWSESRPRVKGGWMKMSQHKSGYLFTMGRHVGRQVPLYAHQLVALAFIGPRPEGMHVCHGDGDAKNNHADNLRYDTPKENVADMIRHGTAAWQR